jgi:hypothetical protein
MKISCVRDTQISKNIGKLTEAQILGKFPTYMRPPYSDCTGQCETDLATLGYHAIYFDLDTEDYLMDDPNLIQNSKDFFLGNLSSSAAADSSWLAISHDIHQQTAYNLTEYMIQTLVAQGFEAVTVGECLGDPATNWYRTLGGGALFTSGSYSAPATSAASAISSTKPVSLSASATASSALSAKSASSVVSSAAPAASNVISTDATCGGTGGFTCQGSTFGNCCSVAGCKFSV